MNKRRYQTTDDVIARYSRAPGPAARPPTNPNLPAPTSSKAVAGFVVALVSVLLPVFGLLTLAGIATGFILSLKGKAEAEAGQGGKGLAVAGIVLSGVAVLIYLLVGIVSAGIMFII